MKNGLAINDCKNMFDKWDGKSSIALSEINRALKDKVSILLVMNQLYYLTKIFSEM